jgi:hypothetical protein
MSHDQYIANKKKIHKKLWQFHKEFKKAGYVAGEEAFSPELIEWFNSICRKYCKLTTKSTFNAQTYWSKLNGPPEGAPFVMGFRGDKFNVEEDSVQYRLFLESHNTQADTDMSDHPIFYIDFKVYPKQELISEYSFVFC